MAVSPLNMALAWTVCMAAIWPTGFALATGEPADPMLPRSSVEDARTLPLRVVTITTGDLIATRRFYQGALGMDMEMVTLRDEDARELAAHWGLGATDVLEIALFRQPGAEGAASVRAISVPEAQASFRPAYDSRIVGPLGFGFPIRGLARRYQMVQAHGFEATADVVSMAFPREDGSTYDVGEFHLMAPDDVLVLGVDRGPLTPIGAIDAALDIGGVAYSSVFVADILETGNFLREVLGLELRREMSFRSSGPEGGLRGLERGQEIAFQQWFSPGASTGYLVVMELLDGEKIADEKPGLWQRGVGMWSFEVRDLEAFLARWEAFSAQSRPAVRAVQLPDLGPVHSVIVHTPDGLPIEIFQRDLHAVAHEPCAAYMIIAGTTLDVARMGRYAAALEASGLYPSVGGRYVNEARPIEVFEGAPHEDHVSLIVRFPTQAAAREFWYSETYQREILPLRVDPLAGDYTVTVYRSAEARAAGVTCDADRMTAQ